MAHFITGAAGGRSAVTRLGTKASGAQCYARGWKVGGAVWIRHVEEEDRVEIELTTGSTGPARILSFGTWALDADRNPIPRDERARRIAAALGELR